MVHEKLRHWWESLRTVARSLTKNIKRHQEHCKGGSSKRKLEGEGTEEVIEYEVIFQFRLDNDYEITQLMTLCQGKYRILKFQLNNIPPEMSEDDVKEISGD